MNNIEKEIVKMLTKEIAWCKKNIEKDKKEFQKAFICGLENARFLIKQGSKLK